jgi:hypothetical protein
VPSSSSSVAYPFRPNAGRAALSPFTAFKPNGGESASSGVEAGISEAWERATDDGHKVSTSTTSPAAALTTATQDDEVYGALLSFMTQGIASAK